MLYASYLSTVCFRIKLERGYDKAEPGQFEKRIFLGMRYILRPRDYRV